MVYAVTSGEATPYLGIRMDRRSTLSGARSTETRSSTARTRRSTRAWTAGHRGGSTCAR